MPFITQKLGLSGQKKRFLSLSLSLSSFSLSLSEFEGLNEVGMGPSEVSK